jgi:hypothetical protein
MILLTNGIAVGFEAAGAGLPEVFLHGYPRDRTFRPAQMDGLAGPHRTTAFDPP